MKELIGRKVIGFRWDENIYTELGWVDDMEESIGEEGVIIDYDPNDDSFQIEFPNDNTYWHPANEAVKYLVEEEIIN